jgi:hypothetical protein
MEQIPDEAAELNGSGLVATSGDRRRLGVRSTRTIVDDRSGLQAAAGEKIGAHLNAALSGG